MLPHYQLPPKSKAASTINLDFSPDQVGSWLSKLANAAPAESAEKLCRFLNAFNRIDLPAGHRDRLAKLIEISAHHLADKLAQTPANPVFPLPGRQHAALRLAQTLLGELATMQKLSVVDALSRGGNADDLLAKLLECIDRLMMISYENHTSLPAGLWQDLHQSFLCLGQTDTATTALADKLSHSYKSLLLLALADPYQLNRQELDWTAALASEMAGISEVLDTGSAKKTLAPFHIQADADDPPQPMGRHYTKAQSHLLFETTGVARRLAMLGNAIKTGRIKEGMSLPHEADWPAYAALLNKLKLRWGASKQRMIQRRKPKEDTLYTATLGLGNLYAAIKASNVPTAQCSTINDSAGGLALAHDGDFGLRIDVGELVGVMQAGGDTWRPGIVRWFKQANESRLMFGLQLLGHKAEPAIVENSASGQTANSLLIYSSGDKFDCLILPADMARAGAQVQLNGGDGKIVVTLAQRMESNPSFELFRVQP